MTDENREERKPSGEKIVPQPIRKSAKQIWQEKTGGAPDPATEETAGERPSPENIAKEPPRPRTGVGERASHQPDSTKAKVPAVLLSPASSAAADRARQSAIVTIALILGGLILLGGVFFVGTKFNYWRYRLMTKLNKPELTVVDKYPNVSVEELIEQAFSAERAKNWPEAIDKLIAAKKKNMALQGVLYRVGRLSFNAGDMVAADAAFERAIAFGEEVDKANFSRGLVALRRSDFPAALRFFEAAAAAAPLTAEYFYFAAEAARLSDKPREAITHYKDAAERATTADDVAVCNFKVDLARMEAGDAGKVELEIQTKKPENDTMIFVPLTQAALKLREGKIEEGVKLIYQARDLSRPRLFRAGTNDIIFKNAASKNAAVAEAIRISIAGAQPVAPAQPAPGAPINSAVAQPSLDGAAETTLGTSPTPSP